MRGGAMLGLIALGTACSFSGVDPAATPDGQVATDAASTSDGAVVDSAPADAAASLLCDPALVDLGGCWEFEDSLLDGSSNGNDGTPVGQPTYVVGGAPGMALQFDGSSGAMFDETATLDAPAITLEAMVFQSQYGGGGAEGKLFDNEGQYAFSVFDDNGRFRCNAADGPAINSDAGVIALDTWHHVVCSFDNTRVRMFIDGDEVQCANRGSPVRIGANAGSATGFNLDGNGDPSGQFFTGRLDSLRVFRAARTAQQICAAAGREDCTEIPIGDCN